MLHAQDEQLERLASRVQREKAVRDSMPAQRVATYASVIKTRCAKSLPASASEPRASPPSRVERLYNDDPPASPASRTSSLSRTSSRLSSSAVVSPVGSLSLSSPGRHRTRQHAATSEIDSLIYETDAQLAQLAVAVRSRGSAQPRSTDGIRVGRNSTDVPSGSPAFGSVTVASTPCQSVLTAPHTEPASTSSAAERLRANDPPASPISRTSTLSGASVVLPVSSLSPSSTSSPTQSLSSKIFPTGLPSRRLSSPSAFEAR